MSDIEKKSFDFANFILNRQFEEAYAMLSENYQNEFSLTELIQSYDDMLHSFDFIEDSMKIASSEEMGIIVEFMEDIDGKLIDIYSSVSINGLISIKNDDGLMERYETYTVFSLVFNKDTHLIDAVNLDARS